jgi:guanosine-3',5'-bis(diphosphate) 3'-pyrophosphohydrolase
MSQPQKPEGQPDLHPAEAVEEVMKLMIAREKKKHPEHWKNENMSPNPGLDAAAFSDFVRALAFASRKHSLQRRKDVEASPYINHPIALVSILAVEAGISDRDTLCAALLHDTIEDTDTTVEELVETFGGAVAALVQEVTDDKSLPKAERKARQVEHAAHLSAKARLIKLADKIANLRDVADNPPADWPLARRQEYFDWAKRVVDRIPQAPPELVALFAAAYDRRP